MIRKKVTESEIEKIEELVKSGVSLNKISYILKRNKSTVYHHFRRFKGRTYLPIDIQTQNQENVAEMLGIFASDGNYFKTKDYNHRVFFFFGPSETKRREEVRLMLTILLNKEPIACHRDNLLILYYCSKRLIEFIKTYLVWKNSQKTYSVKLKKREHSKDFIIGFLRGCFDSDGHISHKQISFSSVSLELAKDVACFLAVLDIKYSLSCYTDKRGNRRPIYRVRIKKNQHSKFIKNIKPRKGK